MGEGGGMVEEGRVGVNEGRRRGGGGVEEAEEAEEGGRTAREGGGWLEGICGPGLPP